MDWNEFKEIAFMMFVTMRNALIIGGAWGGSFLLGKMLPKHFFGRNLRKAYQEEGYGTTILVLFCLSAAWIPGLRPGFPDGGELRDTGIDGTEIGFRIALSICLALIAYGIPAGLMLYVQKKHPEFAKAVKRFLTS